MSHDYAAQKAETFETFEALGEGADLPKSAVITYQFFPESSEPNWEGLSKALTAKGFRCEVFEDEDTMDASFGPIPVTPQEIWKQEKIATEIALTFDFEPDGWVLMEDGA